MEFTTLARLYPGRFMPGFGQGSELWMSKSALIENYPGRPRRNGYCRAGGLLPDLAVVTRVRDDNSGPHTAEEITRMHAELAVKFPNAEIAACNLSDMANAIAPYRDKLPVVTQEIGDTCNSTAARAIR